jgi:hypothetical protein
MAHGLFSGNYSAPNQENENNVCKLFKRRKTQPWLKNSQTGYLLQKQLVKI